MTTKNPFDDVDDVDGELLADLLDAMPAEAPSATLKDRLLKSAAAVTSSQRYASLLDRIASLTDLAREKAVQLVDALDDATRWVGHGTDMAIFHVDGGPRVANAIVGFVRMPAGAVFPEHEHVGDEVMLILQGSLVTSDGQRHAAGEEVPSRAGTAHSFTVAAGPDLMYLGVIQGGMKIDGNVVGPSDPKY